jgi:uncharacterized membrane protein
MEALTVSSGSNVKVGSGLAVGAAVGSGVGVGSAFREASAKATAAAATSSVEITAIRMIRFLLLMSSVPQVKLIHHSTYLAKNQSFSLRVESNNHVW